MKKRLSSIAPPAVAGVIREKTTNGAIAQSKNCYIDGADMLDLHLSCLTSCDEAALRRIIDATPLPVLALNYNKTYEWRDCGLSEEDRVQSFLRAVRCGAAGIDMQGYTFDVASKGGFVGEDIYSFTKGNPKEIVTDAAVIARQCALIDEVHAMGAEVLLSCHPGIVMPCEAVVELAAFLEQRHPDIIKIVTRADTEEDLGESVRTMLMLKEQIKTPIAYHVNGKAGMPSRILNPLLGGQIAFCVDRYDEGSTMEQIDLKTARAAVDNVRKVR